MSQETSSFDLETVQAAIRDAGVDGWLLAQFRGRDPIADTVLGLTEPGLQTRRWFYFVPADGEPRGLVHMIEPHSLDAVPGPKTRYMRWQELREGIGMLVGGARRVAMQYAQNNDIPYVSLVDAGTVELVTAHGVEVTSSAELVQQFTATLDDERIASQRAAAAELPRIVREAFHKVRDAVLAGHEVTEYEIQQFILQRFEDGGLITEEPPIVGVNAHSADPHYGPEPVGSAPIRDGDWLLIDLWARTRMPGAVWSDITWTAQVGAEVPDHRREVFDVVLAARDAAIDLIVGRYAEGREVAGFEADRACQEVIRGAGYGDYIQHRTGHSITDELHGTGAHLDDLETHDFRKLARRTCFSVEPGIYLEEFGVRSEIDMLIPPEGPPEVSGEKQVAPIALLAEDPGI